MGSEMFSSVPYGSQEHPSTDIHMSSGGLTRRSFGVSDGPGYPPANPDPFSSNSYATPLRYTPNPYDTAQGAFPQTMYPESSQRTASIGTATLRSACDAGSFDTFSNYNSNHYEAAFDFDTPHLAATASVNGSIFDRYGRTSLRDASAVDHRSPPSPPGLSRTPNSGSASSTTHVHSQLLSSSTASPLYPPTVASPSHGMTSYTAEASSSDTTSASLFAKVPPTSKGSHSGLGFEMLTSSSELTYGYDDNQSQSHSRHHHRNSHDYHPVTARNSSTSPSIPMSNTSAGWNIGSHGSLVGGYNSLTHSSSSPSRSSTTGTPTLASSHLGGHPAGRMPYPLLPTRTNEASAGSIQLSRQGPPYGSAKVRSSSTSVRPPLDVVYADPGTRSESNSNISLPLSGGGGDIALSLTERREKDGSRPTSSSSVKAGALRPNTPVSTMPLPAEANGGASEELQPPQQAPAKKKKKSKMHTCEICSKKFPRPSGLRTHMNTHNNARPYACGFPGCTRTFGVRSNAKRHLRTHGIIPPPSNPTNGNGEAAYVVGFNPPVIAPERPDASDSGMRDGGVDSVDGLSGQLAKHRLSRAPFFKLRWMPPSLTSRTNSAKLKAVDEATGEISEDEGDSDEEGDEDYGSDRDLDDYGPTGQGGDKDDGPDTKVGIPLLPALSGSISLPSLGVTLRDHHHSSSRGARAPPSRSSSHSSAYSASSSLSSSTNASTVSNSRRSCLCPFSPCHSIPCHSMTNTVNSDEPISYSSPLMDDHSSSGLSMGGEYANSTSSVRSMGLGGFDMGFIGMGQHQSMPLSSQSLSLAHGMGVNLGLAGADIGGLGFRSMGLGASANGRVSSLYARRVGVNAARHPHLLVSA